MGRMCCFFKVLIHRLKLIRSSDLRAACEVNPPFGWRLAVVLEGMPRRARRTPMAPPRLGYTIHSSAREPERRGTGSRSFTGPST